MRCTALLSLSLLTSTLASGCAQDCGAVDQGNGNTYRVMANPVTWESSNPNFTAGPEFWSYGSPANGLAEWQIQWGGAASGPVTVLINGQPFQGTGVQDELECGQATLDFSGEYGDPRTEVSHTFNASMSMSLWVDDEALGRLGAFLVWKESWSHPSGDSGTFTSNSHLDGVLLSQATINGT